ncbi:MAG TPA: hypothetical protein VGD04_07205 [Methylophilus sp.]
MKTRSDQSLAKVIRAGAQLSRNKEFQQARKLLKSAGVCYFTIDRVLYEPHNLRSTD